MVSRIPTKIPGLDKLIQGGTPKGSVVLIAGPPGIYKSISCFQIIYNAALSGKKSMFVTFEQTEADLLEQMQQFGWNKNKVNNKLKIFAIRNNKDMSLLLDELNQKTMKNKYELIGLDSLSSIIARPMTETELNKMSMVEVSNKVSSVQTTYKNIIRERIFNIITNLKQSKATTYLTAEASILGGKNFAEDGSPAYQVDGLILLNRKNIAGRKIKTIEIMKMRKTEIDDTPRTIAISKKGLSVGDEVGGL